MSLAATSYVLSRRFGSQIRKLIMISIADFTGDDTGTAWAFIDTIAMRAECSRRSVQEQLQILEAEGELEIYRNAGPKGSHRFKILKKYTPNEQPLTRGAAGAPLPEKRGAGVARGVQMSAKRGADERRPFAPKTIEQEKNREREKSAEAPRTLATSVSMDDLCDLIDAVNSCRPGWQAAPVLNPKEAAAFKANLPCLQAIDPTAWPILKAYLTASIPEGAPKYQPTSRERFIDGITDVLNYALQWHAKRRPATPPPANVPPAPEEPALSISEMKAILNQKPQP